MIELGKKYRTRDGREVRIYAVDGSGMYPVHGASNRPAGWCLERWTNTGELWANGKEDPYDLIEVQPEQWHPIVAIADCESVNRPAPRLRRALKQ